MKKLALLFVAICLINSDKCNKSGNNSPSTSSNTPTTNRWSSWSSISSYPLKARATRGDSLGGGNYVWQVSIKNDDLGALKFTYKIEVMKGDGTADVTEENATVYPATPITTKVTGASIARISASDVKRAP